VPPTLLEYFGLPVPPDMQGIPLRAAVAEDAPTRDAVLFGVHGGHVNVTDGRYVYMRSCATPENGPIYEYTLMPTHMRAMFAVEELQDIQLAEPFGYSKGCRLMKLPMMRPWIDLSKFGTLLFDLQSDPGQEHPIEDGEVEAAMTAHLVRLMRASEAPPEQYERLGLSRS
jgi:hypothetical protein